MGTAIGSERMAAISPRRKARLAGFFYLITCVVGFFAEMFVRGRLIIPGESQATAASILAHTELFRLGFTGDLIGGICYVVVTVLLYDLLKPVNRTVSLIAAVFSLSGCAVGAVFGVFHLAPLVVLSGDRYLSVYSTEQLQAMALIFLRLHTEGYLIALTFFGLYCFLIGYLIIKSTFISRIIGALMALAGVCYLLNSFANFISPDFASHLFPWVLVPCGIGELSLTFWLLIAGINEQRWYADAAAKPEEI